MIRSKSLISYYKNETLNYREQVRALAPTSLSRHGKGIYEQSKSKTRERDGAALDRLMAANGNVAVDGFAKRPQTVLRLELPGKSTYVRSESKEISHG